MSLVRVDFSVASENHSAANGLTAEDFLIFDQGVKQKAASFSFEQEPLDLILLFDVSSGMRAKLLQVVRAIELGFHELRTGDRVCSMAFNGSTTEVDHFNADLEQVNQKILISLPALRFEGLSNPEQAIKAAALRFRSEPKTQRPRAVLIVNGPEPRPHSQRCTLAA